MGIRKIVKYGDKVLRAESKEVFKVTKKIKELVKDMINTMYVNNGVGLAAPQIGENLRIFVIDTSDPKEPMNPIAFINPKIIEKKGAINSYESCLSLPDAYTNVRRYKYVKIKALNTDGKPFVMEADEGSLTARAIQHEFDHLNGVLFIDHARNIEETNKELTAKCLPLVEEDRLIAEPELEEIIAKEEPKKDD